MNFTEPHFQTPQAARLMIDSFASAIRASLIVKKSGAVQDAALACN